MKTKDAGITLIALIITIIVLLILAGVSISVVVGDNGVLSQVQASSKKTEEAKFLEDANFAYSEIYAEKVQLSNFNGVTEIELVNKLRDNYGYTIISETDGIIGAITPNKSMVCVKNKNTETISIIPDTALSNYVKIKEKYYKINYTNQKISINEAQDTVSEFILESVETSDETIATVSKNANIVTIQGKSSGDATVTVKYTDSITTIIPVKVVEYGMEVDIGNVEVNNRVLENGWQYFYDDTSNVYLIYSDYLENAQIPSGTNIIISGYNIFTSSFYEKNIIGDYLENTDIWKEFAKGITDKLVEKGLNISGATATGDPTPEMWTESYNEKWGTSLGARYFDTTGVTYYKSSDGNALEVGDTEYKTEIEGYLFSRDITDNVIKWEDEINIGYMTNLAGYPTNSSNMWYPHTGAWNATYGYYLLRLSSFRYWRRSLSYS